MRKGDRVKTGASKGARSAGGLSLESPVWELPLTGKERGALLALGVVTVREFLDLDVRRVLKVRRYGAVTYARLNASQQALREKLFPGRGGRDEIGSFLRKGVAELDRLPSDFRASLIKDQREEVSEARRLAAARTQMTDTSWRLLPLFSGTPLSGIRADELHASYYPGVPISYLRLGIVCEEVLAVASVRSLGELLLTPYGQLMGPNELSVVSLVRLQALVKEFLCGPEEHALPEVDYSTPEGFLASLVARVLRDERQRRILLNRIGWRGPPPTLEALAQEYGVTRERIRQIEKKAHQKLTHWSARNALAPLHDFVRSLLSGHSGPVSIALICQRLQDRHKWPRPLGQRALRKLLPAFPDVKMVGEEHVVIAQGGR